uniref:Uncharacterized protein n=1 Tax=Ananas comosus var. bracteatus TaxID=296719 RepID=A0A6V7NTC7_ANACO|nr:unnamed protein product [Ananas comosus var. bracteatus]
MATTKTMARTTMTTTKTTTETTAIAIAEMIVTTVTVIGYPPAWGLDHTHIVCVTLAWSLHPSSELRSSSRVGADIVFFQIFWRVVDSVSTYGSYPENCSIYSSAKVTEVEDLGSSQVASAGLCTGTTLKLYRNKWLYLYIIGSIPVHLAVFYEPEPRICAYRILYQYTFPCTGTQCSLQTACSGRVFLQLLLIYKAPHAPLEFPELETRGGESREAI